MWLLDLQIQYLLWLQSLREYTNGVFDNFFICSTWLGEIVVPFTFLSIIYWGISKKAGSFLFLTFSINLYFNVFLKMAACIHRPWVLDKRVCPIESVMPMADGYSFPSGHTAGAMSVWGATAFWFWNNKFIRYIMIFFVCLVAFSRNYVGVHTPQDVLASIIIGIFVILFSSKVQKWIDAKSNRDNIFFVLAMIFGILLCLFLQIKCNLQMLNYDSANDLVSPLAMKHSAYSKVGFYFGLILGWFWERKFVNFEVAQGWSLKKICLIIFGIILLFSSALCLKKILLLVMAKRFAYGLISLYVGLFMTFLYPWVMKKLNNILRY